jgi:hypothetical protein
LGVNVTAGSLDLLNVISNIAANDVKYATGTDWWGWDPFRTDSADRLAQFGTDLAGHIGIEHVDPRIIPSSARAQTDVLRQFGEMVADPGPALAKVFAGLGPMAKAIFLAPMAMTAEKEVLKTWSHPISNIKLRRPLEDMTATYRPGTPLVPRKEFDFESAPMGSLFFHFSGDRSAASKTLTGVNDQLFQDSIALRNGSDFMRTLEAEANKVFWANASSVAKVLEGRIRKLQETGNPVFGAFAAMGPLAVDYQSAMTRALLELIKLGKPLAPEAKNAFDVAMRSPWRDFRAVPDFPGIGSITDDWLTTAGWRRNKIAKLMDTDRFQSIGFPDVGSARRALTLPELLNVPTGATGHNIVRVGPEPVVRITDPKVPLPDFRTQLESGSYAGSSTVQFPIDIFWSDWMKTRPQGEHPYKTMISFWRQPVVQRKTPEWLDRLMSYKMSAEGRKLGLAGAIAAGLITANEAQELFGFEGRT